MAPPKKQSDRPGYEIKGSSRARAHCKQILNKVVLKSAKPFQAFKKLSRPIQLGLIYLAVGLAAASVFFWQMWSLRAAHPYIEDNPGLKEDMEGEPLEIVTIDPPVEGDPVRPGERLETAEPPPDPAAGIPTSEGASTPLTGADNSPGDDQTAAVWPLTGELWYRYHDPVIQKLNPPYTKYHFSKGLAIKAAPGEAVCAIWAGTVSQISEQGYPYGKAVIVKHENGLTAYYGALQTVAVTGGERLAAAGKVGHLAEGVAGDPSFLYLEIRENQETVDPFLYLPPGDGSRPAK